MKLIQDLWFKRRDIISDGFDESLEYISKIIPLEIHEIPSGTKCWTWIVPHKWSVNEAQIRDLDGKILLDLKNHPLHVVSYSLPIDKIVSRTELLQHLHTNSNRPDAIPFEFRYYRKDWGFCIQQNRLKEFTQNKYRVCIDSRFEKGALKVGDFTIKGQVSPKTIVLMAHLCHPAMANDDLAGVAVLVKIAKYLNQRSNHYTYKFLFLPETIGSIAYLSQNEEIIPQLKYGIFLEMPGNKSPLALQFSRQGNTLLDRIARFVLQKECRFFREGPFGRIVRNDDKVLNGPGINVPTISLSRYPYPEYHTSDDNPDIISEASLDEVRRLIVKILEILDNNYIPRRLFKGPVFLSRFGLWVDWRVDEKLNQDMDQIMLRFEGDKSIFDIADELGMKFNDTLNYVNQFVKHKLVTQKW